MTHKFQSQLETVESEFAWVRIPSDVISPGYSPKKTIEWSASASAKHFAGKESAQVDPNQPIAVGAHSCQQCSPNTTSNENAPKKVLNIKRKTQAT